MYTLIDEYHLIDFPSQVSVVVTFLNNARVDPNLLCAQIACDDDGIAEFAR